MTWTEWERAVAPHCVAQCHHARCRMARERDAATYSPAERAREKQASRDEDQRRLDAGEVTPAELQAENSLFHGVEVRPVLRAPRHVRLNDVEKQVAREFTFAAMSEVRSSIDFVMRALFTPLGCSF